MTQKNRMSARALAMEELENVNGGKVTTGLKHAKETLKGENTRQGFW